MTRSFTHVPVMLAEVVDLFAPVPDGTVVDATVGGGGHSEALLESKPGLLVVGLDRDAAAVAAARDRLERYGRRVRIHHARFDRLREIAAEDAATPLSGVLFDLGVSSHQLDEAERGFAFRHDGPVDMRMDQSQQFSAAALLNEAAAEEIARVLGDGGETRWARRIAAAIVRGRPISTTGQLAELVRAAIPAAARRTGGHPATRTFQALRIAVNEELTILPGAIDDAIAALKPRGRCVVLSYHSGEDRIVKDRFTAAATGGCTCPVGLPCGCGATPTVRLLNRGARKPTAEEIAGNHRAESARLRAVERLEVA